MLAEVEKALKKFRDRVVQQSRSNLTRNKQNSSKQLYNSIKGNVKVSKNSFELAFKMEDYGDFQDKGVKGKNSTHSSASKSPFKYKNKRPPSSVFLPWIKSKGLKGRDKKGRFITNQSLSYLIARSVYQKGMKASMFFTRPFEQNFKKLPKDIVEAFALDFESLMKTSRRNG